MADDRAQPLRKTTLDKDLSKFAEVSETAGLFAGRMLAPGLAFLFLVVAAALASGAVFGESAGWVAVAAAALAGYMALTIGANDVANNVGPAVGARALTIAGALVIAALCEVAGALIAGGYVVDTLANRVIDDSALADPVALMRIMLSALLAAAVWVHAATWLGAPISTTHSIVGAIVGAGLVSAGLNAAHWDTISAIATGWIISPLAGGVIAASILGFVNASIIYQDDKIAAAQRWVPVLIAVMAGAFFAYLLIVGFPRLELGGIEVAALTLPVLVVCYFYIRHRIIRIAPGLENRNQSLRVLFRAPLIFSAALLSFAHGANDVSNAVGPLAAIVSTIRGNEIGGTVVAPFWIMLIGGAGISAGLLLFGPKLIRVVGEQITRLNPIRAFCVALATAVTVLIATALGMPVSSTHIAVGAVFGVGFFREWYTAHSTRRRAYVQRKAARNAAVVRPAKPAPLPRDVKIDIRSGPSREAIRRRRLVRRAHVSTIVMAWFATVPGAAALSACFYVLLTVAS